MRIKDCKLVDIRRIASDSGSLAFIEGSRDIPFDVKRVYFLYDVPAGAVRGSHAHKSLSQLFIAASGSFDVHLDDGYNKASYHLNRPFYGLYVPPLLWRTLDNFSSGSVCIVMASDYYEESDYIRDYHDFRHSLASRPER